MTTYRFIREVAKEALYSPGHVVPERVEITVEDWEMNFSGLVTLLMRFARACEFPVDETDLCIDDLAAPMFEKQDRYIEELEDRVSLLTEENEKLAAKMPEFEP